MKYDFVVEQHGLPMVPVDPSFRFAFMARVERVIGHDGIHLKGLRYDSRALDAVRQRQKWPVYYDDKDVSCVYVNLNEMIAGPTHFVKVPWIHRPPQFAIPFPERARDFLRRHRAIHDISNEPLGWEEHDSGADQLSSEEIGDRAEAFRKWVRDLQRVSQERGFEQKPVVQILNSIVDACRTSETWRQASEATSSKAVELGLTQEDHAVLDGLTSEGDEDEPPMPLA